jgi:NosR/NirI family transcriptional regulator, nitrous oxide reductase regulator
MLAVRSLLLVATLFAAPALADIGATYPQARGWFPEAVRFGVLEGEPRAAPAYDGRGAIAGYVFLTDDVVRIPAYSGRPINSLVGIDVAGRIRGVVIVEHHEPILEIGVSEERLRAFSEQYRGKSVLERIVVGAERPGAISVDTISGATITVMVQNETLMRAARRVAESRGLTSEIRVESAEPLWVGVWRERKFSIAVLAGGLAALTVILLIQDVLARRPRLLAALRRAFLLYTLFFVGWYALAQLSIVHVLTFLHAVMHDFKWETFLIDPMLFILWSFVAMTLLLWGRGVYCGWLCPFGAAQELVQQGARRLGVRQLEFPDVVHERLWALKYLILLVLFGVSLQSMSEAARLAEVEPFKTAVTLRFEREWPFVLYAAALIAVSAVNRKLFCKYLCPLGAALSIPGRFRVFDWWLRRRRECGRPCQTCANDCEVRAIRPTGEINANECHYCLDCQVTYYDDRRCMPLIERRVKREQRRSPARQDAKLIHIKPVATPRK